MVDSEPGRHGLTTRALVLALCLLAGAAAIAKASRTERVPARESFATFPVQLGPWEGRSSERFTDQILSVLGVDEYLSRTYEAPGVGAVHLYVGFYESQRQGDTMHSPLNCLPGAGWEPMRREHLFIPVRASAAPASPTRTIEVNRIVIQRGLDRQMVIYWYQSHGRTVASEYWGKLYTVLDAIRLNRTDAAMIRVMAPITSGDDAAVAAAEKLTQGFVETMFPQLSRYLPE